MVTPRAHPESKSVLFSFGAMDDITPPNHDEIEIEALEDLARLLDTRWSIPGTNVRFGVDAVIGLVPGLGDAASGIVSALVYRAAQLGAPRLLLARMAGIVALDTLVGSVPLVGSVFDVFFRANRRNIRLLRNHLDKRRRRGRPNRFSAEVGEAKVRV